VLVTVAVIVVGKSLAAVALVLVLRYSVHTALTVSASLAQVGEFSFILAGLGMSLGLLPKEGQSLILAGALISMALNPFVFSAIAPVQRWLQRHPRLAHRFEPEANPLAALPMSTEAKYLSNQVVLVGWGRVGKHIADTLSAAGIPFVVVESNREPVEALREQGIPAVWGDATTPGCWSGPRQGGGGAGHRDTGHRRGAQDGADQRALNPGVAASCAATTPGAERPGRRHRHVAAKATRRKRWCDTCRLRQGAGLKRGATALRRRHCDTVGSTSRPTDERPDRRRFQTFVAGVAAGAWPVARGAAAMPLFDAHIHYSHDAWDLVPPKQAVEILRNAGLRGALVSASNDEGTQMLIAEAPDLIVPELRPYRHRAEIGTWARDETVLRYLEERLGRFRYAGIGEFHLAVRTPICGAAPDGRAARQHGLLLHAHSDIDAIGACSANGPDACCGRTRLRPAGAGARGAAAPSASVVGPGVSRRP
jgi:hypothetical protein